MYCSCSLASINTIYNIKWKYIRSFLYNCMIDKIYADKVYLCIINFGNNLYHIFCYISTQRKFMYKNIYDVFIGRIKSFRQKMFRLFLLLLTRFYNAFLRPVACARLKWSFTYYLCARATITKTLQGINCTENSWCTQSSVSIANMWKEVKCSRNER